MTNTSKPGSTEVWWVDTRTAGASLDQFAQETGVLSAQDIEGRSDESRRTRIILRFALSRYGDKDLVLCPIEAAAAGRPFLLDPDGPSFSISHSGDHIAVAIAADGPVGIDIERIRQIKMSTKRQLQIANQARAHGIDAAIDAEAAADGDEFLSLWTKLEALGKARGDGIGAVLTELKTQHNEATANLFSKVGSATIQVRSLLLTTELAGALVTADSKGTHDVYEVPNDLSVLLAQFETNCSH
ncbi:MAG: hypothetical protein CMB79_11515 [Filomicrobium sp.]|nr:hypothetical protein [Filomicrobium sp.]